MPTEVVQSALALAACVALTGGSHRDQAAIIGATTEFMTKNHTAEADIEKMEIAATNTR